MRMCKQYDHMGGIYCFTLYYYKQKYLLIIVDTVRFTNPLTTAV